MGRRGFLLPAAASLIQLACSSPQSPATAKSAAVAVEPVRITQLYATAPNLVRGQQELICYGVENSRTVWLEPPRQELSNAQSRCVEVTPAETTTYTLTAQGASGKPVSQSLTVHVTAPAARAKLVNVQFTSLELKSGDVLGICYQAQNAKSVRVEPIHFEGPGDKGCAHVQPKETTTYVVTAYGTSGDTDEERATVKVR